MVASVLGTIVSSDSAWTNQNDTQKSEAAQMILTSAVSLVSALIKPTANVTSKKVKSEKLGKACAILARSVSTETIALNSFYSLLMLFLYAFLCVLALQWILWFILVPLLF